MEMHQIYKHVKCCVCGGALDPTPIALQIPVTITWDFPKWGNFITGAKDQGLAYICDACANAQVKYEDVKSVVEFFSNNGVKYHSITWVTGPNNRLIAQLT